MWSWAASPYLLVVGSQGSTDRKVGPVASELAHQLGLEVLDARRLSDDEVGVAPSGDPDEQGPGVTGLALPVDAGARHLIIAGAAAAPDAAHRILTEVIPALTGS